MLVPHPFDIIAILLGIFLALRKSDVRSDDASRYPTLTRVDFDRWQQLALGAYTLGTRVCFFRVLADFAFLAYLQRSSMDLTLQRVLGVSLDLVWVALLGLVWVRSRRARHFMEELGVDLRQQPARDVGDQA